MQVPEHLIRRKHIAHSILPGVEAREIGYCERLLTQSSRVSCNQRQGRSQ
jgi:hypothetical protein